MASLILTGTYLLTGTLPNELLTQSREIGIEPTTTSVFRVAVRYLKVQSVLTEGVLDLCSVVGA